MGQFDPTPSPANVVLPPASVGALNAFNNAFTAFPEHRLMTRDRDLRYPQGTGGTIISRLTAVEGWRGRYFYFEWVPKVTQWIGDQ